MDDSSIDAFIDELLKKTREGRVPWQKSAVGDQFVASIGGKYSLALSGPSWRESLFKQLTSKERPDCRLFLKDISGTVIFDIGPTNYSSPLTAQLTTHAPERRQKLFELLEIVIRKTSPDASRINDAIDAVKEL